MTTDDATIDQHTRMIGAPMPTAGPSADRAMVFRAVAALVAAADADLPLGALTDGQRSLLVDALASLTARDASDPTTRADVADVAKAREGDRVRRHRPAPLHALGGHEDGATGQGGNGATDTPARAPTGQARPLPSQLYHIRRRRGRAAIPWLTRRATRRTARAAPAARSPPQGTEPPRTRSRSRIKGVTSVVPPHFPECDFVVPARYHAC